MESATPRATPRATRSSLNVLLRISDLCKLSSVGAEPTPINTKSIDPKEIIDEFKDQKVHPVYSTEESTVSNLFYSISALKLAYIQLQQAHIPYDAKKIKAADKLIISQLESVSKLEDLYSEKELGKPKCQSTLPMKIQEQEKLLVVLEKIIQDKESDIERLKSELDELRKSNTESKEKIKKKPLSEKEFSLANRELTPNLFTEAFRFASRSVHDFAKPLISLMRVSGWNLDEAVHSMYNSVIFHERSHKKYAFESYLSQIMFAGGKDRCLLSMDEFDWVMGFNDPFDSLTLDPDSNFGRFCREKYLLALPKEMEDSFFGNLDHRVFVTGGGHPRTLFYQVFVKMAKWIWALQVMALTFIPKAEIFHVREGSEFKKDYMESAVSELGFKRGEKIRVGFTVTPGFKIGDTIVRCRVYLSKDFEFGE